VILILAKMSLIFLIFNAFGCTTAVLLGFVADTWNQT
jgi:hypothetical protein